MPSSTEELDSFCTNKQYYSRLTVDSGELILLVVYMVVLYNRRSQIPFFSFCLFLIFYLLFFGRSVLIAFQRLRCLRFIVWVFYPVTLIYEYQICYP